MTTSHADPVELAYFIIEEESQTDTGARWLQKVFDNRLLDNNRTTDCLTPTDIGNIARGKSLPTETVDHTHRCKTCRAILNLWYGLIRKRARERSKD